MKELKITKGELKNEGGDNTSIDLILSNGATISIDRYNRYTGDLAMSRGEMNADADLIAETFTVANECGKTPRELLEERNELRNVCKELLNLLAFHGYSNATEIYNAQEALDKTSN